MPGKNPPGRLRAVVPPDSAVKDQPRSTSNTLFVDTPTAKSSLRREGFHRAWICQLAVALTQSAFVLGSVYLKSSLAHVDSSKGEEFSPVVFAFGREVIAGPLLYAIAWISTRVAAPAREDAWKVASLGCCLFCSQLFYIIGIELSGVVAATCMQPAIPVFTVLLGVILQMEMASVRKLSGIALAVLGAMCMVVGGAAATGEGTVTSQSTAAVTHMALGNVCFLVNTLAMATYYVVAKGLLSKYTPAQVSAWAYLVGAALMGCTALVFTTPREWHIPLALLPTLAYWVLVCSIGGYYVVTWAMCHLPASQVAAFQCLQPFLGALLAFLLLHERLSWWDTGAVGIVIGLWLVTTDKQDVQLGDMLGRLRGMVASKSRILLHPKELA